MVEGEGIVVELEEGWILLSTVKDDRALFSLLYSYIYIVSFFH